MLMIGSRACFYSRDINAEGPVNLPVIFGVFNDANNFASWYILTDLNGDKIAELADIIIAFNNSNKLIGVIRP